MMRKLVLEYWLDVFLLQNWNGDQTMVPEDPINEAIFDC